MSTPVDPANLMIVPGPLTFRYLDVPNNIYCTATGIEHEACCEIYRVHGDRARTLIAEIVYRQSLGIAKYGRSLREAVEAGENIQRHTAEELMDAINYIFAKSNITADDLNLRRVLVANAMRLLNP